MVGKPQISFEPNYINTLKRHSKKTSPHPEMFGFSQSKKTGLLK